MFKIENKTSLCHTGSSTLKKDGAPPAKPLIRNPKTENQST